MIESYISKFIENLPPEITQTKKPQHLNLVLDGGMFNGGYLIGALYFIKEMEARQYLVIHKISGCSIGSICALLYFNETLDFFFPFYELAQTQLKTAHNLDKITEITRQLTAILKPDILARVNKRFYVTYYNVKAGKKIVKSKFTSIDNLIKSIIRSCFIPLLINGEMLYQKKYIDGINPYFFSHSDSQHTHTREKEKEKYKEKEPIKMKTLYLNLLTFSKVGDVCNIKNEKTTYHRVLAGLLEIHNFFIKGYNSGGNGNRHRNKTDMCCYVEEMGITDKAVYLMRIIIEMIFVRIIYLWYYLLNNCGIRLDIFGFGEKNGGGDGEGIIHKLVKHIFKDIFGILLEHYFV